jgi:hypothetical protein
MQALLLAPSQLAEQAGSRRSSARQRLQHQSC